MLELFHKDIRTKSAFMEHSVAISPVILKKGQELLEISIPVLMARHETKGQMERLKKENRFNPVLLQFLSELDNLVDQLVPPNFITLYDIHRFGDLERYLKAGIIRAQRALVSIEKDLHKAREIKIFSDKLVELLKSLTPETSTDKRNAIEEFFWLIEEYKVSVFAQELKTPIKISAKKLTTRIKEIERMV